MVIQIGRLVLTDGIWVLCLSFLFCLNVSGVTENKLLGDDAFLILLIIFIATVVETTSH